MMKTVKPIEEKVFFDTVCQSKKIMPVMKEIANIFEQKKCTYNEMDVILYLLTDTVQQIASEENINYKWIMFP